MKKLDRNKGFTLIELLVSIAILSLIIVAVGGIMYSNNLIYRKEKADITVQGSAQDVYNKINEDIMQAKHIYLEGYVTDDKIKFTSNKIESNSVGVTPKNFLLPTDQYVLDELLEGAVVYNADTLEKIYLLQQIILYLNNSVFSLFFRCYK